MPLHRIDRWATLYFVRPVRRLAPSRTVAIPVLMYHGVPAAEARARDSYFSTATVLAVFAAHLRYLHENHYRTLTLSEAYDLVHTSTAPNPRAVVITFDDGYRDFYTNAFPALSQYGYSATVFLPTAYIADTSRTFHGVECLTWSEVRTLQTAGIEFGSHTATHPQLRTVATETLIDEVRSSKQRIEDALGNRVKSFSYPFAFPQADSRFVLILRQILVDAGYENGVSTVIGRLDRTGDMMFMKRLPMNSYDDCSLFRAKIEGAYDWLQTLQFASKSIKTRLEKTSY